jgi:multicomponent Na+:H+ antiporter subunit B
MTLRARTWLCAVGALGVAVLFVTAFLRMPEFGGTLHAYRDLALPAAIAHATPNLVSSVNFDLRALDTLGEETIVAAAVVGTLSLLQPSREERQRIEPQRGYVMPVVKLAGYLMLPVTLLLGIDVVVHGHLTPGGGFQGGVVLASAFALVYLAGEYHGYRKLVPTPAVDFVEGTGAGAYAVIGLVSLLLGTAYLHNFGPLGTSGTLASGGTISMLNIASALEVSAAFVLLFTEFLEELIAAEEHR